MIDVKIMTLISKYLKLFNSVQKTTTSPFKMLSTKCLEPIYIYIYIYIYLIYMYKENLALNNQQCLICHKPIKTNHSYLIYMYKEDLALNNLQWLICHKQSQTKSYMFYKYVYLEDLALNNLQWLICHQIQPNQILYI